LKEVEGESPRQLEPFSSHSPTQTASQAENIRPNLLGDSSDLQVSIESDEVSVPSHPRDNEAPNQTPSTNVMSADNRGFSGCGQVCTSLHSRLFETSQLQYSSTTGQLSYLGPAERLQHYCDGFTQSPGAPPGLWHMQRRLHHIVSELEQQTYDYLMTCFWSSYNEHLKIVDKEAFQQHKIEDGDQLHYSIFLHLCCLAMGFRFADKSRADIQPLTRTNRDSVFHENVRYMVEDELKKPHGLTTIQSLLILGDLEYARGSNQMGWMYTGLSDPSGAAFGAVLIPLR
jgi:hypothetical protein